MNEGLAIRIAATETTTAKVEYFQNGSDFLCLNE